MRTGELADMGIPRGSVMNLAKQAMARLAKTENRQQIRQTISALVAEPKAFLSHEVLAELAQALIETTEARTGYRERAEPAQYRVWGSHLEEQAVSQMDNACRLPVSVAGALMPDAHVGYGLPIGGVLGTCNAVIPYAVGVDIACRMRMSVLDLPVRVLQGESGRLKKAIEEETRFGVGATFKRKREHGVMDEDWSFSPVTRQHRDKAWAQLGTSGSGNHFVEFGTLTLERPALHLDPGTYLALLSHSGSRGTGSSVADHYSTVARQRHPELPAELAYLAWLDLDQAEGQEYWKAMELMGRYAAANHELIHKHVVRHLNARVLTHVENHHNFAWKETHYGQAMIVHRKGATPAGPGVLGIIPGSMGTPGYVVQGKGEPASLHSASHGAGRRMSRKAAKEQFTWSDVRRYLQDRGITLLSADLDEAPMAYKDIEEVMKAQADLVEPLARFDPVLVKMSPAGERPED